MSQQNLKVRRVTMWKPDGSAVVIEGANITELNQLPSGLPMVTHKTFDGLIKRTGGLPFEFEMESPSAIDVVGPDAMPGRRIQ